MPGAIGAMATVEVTALDVPTEVRQDDVERRLVAFPQKLRTVTRASRIERIRTDDRTAMERFHDWAGLDVRTAAGHPRETYPQLRRPDVPSIWHIARVALDSDVRRGALSGWLNLSA